MTNCSYLYSVQEDRIESADSSRNWREREEIAGINANTALITLLYELEISKSLQGSPPGDE